MNADGTGLRYFDFHQPNQVMWHPGPFLSDGRRVVFLSMEARRDGPGRPFEEYYTQTPSHLWLYDLGRGLPVRFSFARGISREPIWSPDGKYIYFQSNRTGTFNIYRRPANGSADDELVYAAKAGNSPATISPDGSVLLFTEGQDIFALPLTQPKAEPRPYLATPFSELRPKFSPDGKWVAYQSNESGKDEIYVRPFPEVNNGRWQVSTMGGTQPRWARNTGKLYYHTPTNVFFEVLQGPFNAI